MLVQTPAGHGSACSMVSVYSVQRTLAERYLPCMVDCDYEDSLWEVRTVLPMSEYDDSRPILYVEDCGLKGLTCILGAKIDNIYDMIDFVQQPC